MKKIWIGIALASMFVCGLVLASAKGPIFEKHKGKNGLNGEAVNCAYCHGKEKANVPKTKGNDLAKLKTNKYCAIKGCH